MDGVEAEIVYTPDGKKTWYAPLASAVTSSSAPEMIETMPALNEAREALMATWRSAPTAGAKGGATRRIRNIEAALTDRGVEFEPAPLSGSRGPSADLP